jgi:hypothetical protein
MGAMFAIWRGAGGMKSYAGSIREQAGANQPHVVDYCHPANTTCMLVLDATTFRGLIRDSALNSTLALARGDIRRPQLANEPRHNAASSSSSHGQVSHFVSAPPNLTYI